MILIGLLKCPINNMFKIGLINLDKVLDQLTIFNEIGRIGAIAHFA